MLGYANTDEFDEKAGTGWIRAVPAPDDATNLRKLVRQWIDAAVIDRFVLSYLLATDETISDAGAEIRFNAGPLEEKTLYLCFFEDEEGRQLRARFNKRLATLDVDAIVDDYFREEY